jgi:hypothetical protein
MDWGHWKVSFASDVILKPVSANDNDYIAHSSDRQTHENKDFSDF